VAAAAAKRRRSYQQRNRNQRNSVIIASWRESGSENSSIITKAVYVRSNISNQHQRKISISVAGGGEKESGISWRIKRNVIAHWRKSGNGKMTRRTTSNASAVAAYRKQHQLFSAACISASAAASSKRRKAYHRRNGESGRIANMKIWQRA